MQKTLFSFFSQPAKSPAAGAASAASETAASQTPTPPASGSSKGSGVATPVVKSQPAAARKSEPAIRAKPIMSRPLVSPVTADALVLERTPTSIGSKRSNEDAASVSPPEEQMQQPKRLVKRTSASVFEEVFILL
jgi:hypothetical protein